MKILRHLLYLVFICLALPSGGSAQTLQLKDGKVLFATEMRREGNFLFVKIAAPDGSVKDELVQLPQLERVDFGDLPALVEARQLAQSGDAAGVLEKTTQPAGFFRAYADLPGNPWPDVMRLRLPALAVAGTAEMLSALQKNWAPTGDAELDTAFRLLAAGQNDPAGARTAWKALAQPGTGTLAAAISWLEIGQAELAAKQWRSAARAFLAVEVFVPQHRLLLPKALLGAAKAFKEKGDHAKAAALIRDLESDFPGTPEAAAAPDLLK
jgi:TolA-binding protein